MSKRFKQRIEEAKQREAYWIAEATHRFTEDLYKIMTEKGITKADLAEKIGTSRPYITKVMRGNANLTLSTMVKLTRAVGVKLTVTLEDLSAMVHAATD